MLWRQVFGPSDALDFVQQHLKVRLLRYKKMLRRQVFGPSDALDFVQQHLKVFGPSDALDFVQQHLKACEFHNVIRQNCFHNLVMKPLYKCVPRIQSECFSKF
ncbi:hypothetical protein Syun_013984 [Stephania yunnanensis]|uniref:Uncharacterized protein n=1 Tax=Stephania yunnanensis TaxID=152371 RepID=A0AAP0JIP1_9MAGN